MLDLTIAIYCTVIPAAVSFGCYAIYMAYMERKTQKEKVNDVAYFISAQGSQPLHRVVFSFISTTLGAWVVFAPSGYALTSGYLGLVAYALSGGIPLIVPALFGPLVQKHGGALSLNDFVKKRFGSIAEYFVMALVLYNMANGIAGEYTAVGDLFEKVAGGSRLLIVILLGSVTCIYTAYGGLSVSVKTDQVQTISVLIMVFVFSIYMAANFRLDTSKPLTNDYGDLSYNQYGQAAFCTSIFSFFGWVVYSESFWQKAWVAKKSSDLRKAGLIAGITVVIIVFLFGFYGYIAIWNGNPCNDVNIALFSIFIDSKPEWVVVLVCLTCVIMSESTMDSYQIGMGSTISSCILKNCPLWATQLVVILINIPIIIVSLENLPINNLYLSANLTTAIASPPLLLGFVPFMKDYYGSLSLIGGTLSGWMFASIWGVQQMNGDISKGLNLVFYDGLFCWQTFLGGSFGAAGVALFLSFLTFIYNKITLRFFPSKRRNRLIMFF